MPGCTKDFPYSILINLNNYTTSRLLLLLLLTSKEAGALSKYPSYDRIITGSKICAKGLRFPWREVHFEPRSTLVRAHACVGASA